MFDCIVQIGSLLCVDVKATVNKIPKYFKAQSLEVPYNYSRTSVIQTPVCHFNVKGVQINEFAWISGLSDKIHYLAS